MSYTATVYKVMIASPGDVQQERDTIREVVAEWNTIHSEERGIVLLPVGWETHSNPEMGSHPQTIISRQVLAGCDLLIAAFWTKLGTRTPKAASGTVQEIEEHIAAGRPAMLYFSSAPVRLDSVDRKQYDALTKFKEECFKQGLVGVYDSLDEFRDKVRRQLTQVVISSGWGDEPTPAEAGTGDVFDELSEYALQILSVIGQGSDGQIMVLQDSEGCHVQAAGRVLFRGHNDRESARWKQAVRQLCGADLASDETGRGMIFALTAAGWQVAERLQTTPATAPPDPA